MARISCYRSLHLAGQAPKTICPCLQSEDSTKEETHRSWKTKSVEVSTEEITKATNLASGEQVPAVVKLINTNVAFVTLKQCLKTFFAII